MDIYRLVEAYTRHRPRNSDRRNGRRHNDAGAVDAFTRNQVAFPIFGQITFHHRASLKAVRLSK
jgi:hypothetical protein